MPTNRILPTSPSIIIRKVGAHVSTAGGLPNAITNALNIGADCTQIFAGSPRAWARAPFDPIQVSEFKELEETKHITPTFIHALYLVNLASDNQELLHHSVQSLVSDLNNGFLIDSAGVIVHLGSHQGRGFEVVADQMVALINQILRETRGINFIIENSAGQKGKIGSLAEIKYLRDQIQNERIKLCLDTAHLFEAGYDLRQDSAVASLVNEIKEAGLLSDLVCLHLNDSKTHFNSKHDQHANLGEGEIGLDGLSNFVNHPELSHLPLILEVPGEKGFADVKNILAAKSIAQLN